MLVLNINLKRFTLNWYEKNIKNQALGFFA